MKKKLLIGALAVLAVAAASLAVSGAANATGTTPAVSSSVSRHGYQYGCEIPVKGSSVPLLDIHGTYTGTQKCGTGHQLDVIYMGPLPASGTGPKGDKGDPGTNGTNGTDGKDGKDGTNAQALPYGIALVNVSRGGATAATWATLSTTLGSPVGDNTSETFRMSCSTAKAPCVITVAAYATVAGVHVYPRLDINREDTNGVPQGNCEYADGVDNNNSASPELSTSPSSPSDVKLGIGGTLDCTSAQTYPANGIASEIDVPAGFYDIAATFTFTK